MAANKKETESTVFTKEQILSAKKYKKFQDVLDVVLSKDKKYTLEKVDVLIEKFMKGEVK